MLHWYRGQPFHDKEQVLTIYSYWEAVVHRFDSNYFLHLSETSKLPIYQSLYKSNIKSDSETR